MAQTHYIEIDEEIISAVGRLRKSSEMENIFVFPKRALILQSIINLKLLSREAEKLGKRVVVMSQDEQGTRLAEKAGLQVQEYQEMSRYEVQPDNTARFTVRHGENIPMPAAQDPNTRRRSDEIGSSSFFTNATQPNASQPALPPEGRERVMPERENIQAPAKTLRVRNMTPPVQPSLNSMRGPEPAPPRPTPQAPQTNFSSPVPPQTVGAPGMTERKEKLRRLFQGKNETASFPTPPLSEPPMSPSRSAASSSGHFFRWGVPVGGLILAAGVVLFGYLYLRPTANVFVEPQTAEQTVRLSLVGTEDGVASNTTIPARFIGMEKTVHMTRDATGSGAGNAAKASGTIVIMNDFSEASQSLVATTRFETKDGKIFRLVEGVTVPGVKDSGDSRTPGKIEAKVMADAAGEKYNIEATTFTIPGFKGGPKYEKITAESTKRFSGGSDTTNSDSTVVSQADLDEAKKAASEEAKKTVMAEIGKDLKNGESALDPSFQMSIVGTPTAPSPGTAAKTFDYEARFLVRGFLVSERAIRDLIDKQTAESAGVSLTPYQYAIEYGAVLPNIEAKKVDLTVQSKVLFRAPLNAETLKNGLLGKDEEGIRAFLGEHPEIKRLQVEFKPKLFIATIPSDPDRVNVVFSEMP